MKHPGEEQLVLFYYGEVPGRAVIERHLGSCDACRAAYQSLAAMLDHIEAVPAPERGPEYGGDVWQRLRPRLAGPERAAWTALLTPRRWALAGAMAVLVVAAFFAGRFWPSRPAGVPQPLAPQVRERILLVAVGDHLERSQAVLLELINSGAEDGVDITNEQRRAADLIAANRLYRQTAARAGEPGLANMLEELERVLIEIAHSPNRLSASELDRLRQRLEQQGIIFKVRILDSEVRRKAGLPGQAPSSL